MFVLNYTVNNSKMQIKFADLHSACLSARALDSLKENGTVSNIFVGNEDGDGVYLVPSLKYLLENPV